MIDAHTVQRIIDAAEITEVVQEFVSLKKRGTNFLGLCPFHNEKTPSFNVSPARGIYKCFGCGKGGNSVNFIMDHEKISYPEALKYLARKYSIEIVEKEETAEDIKQKNERESLIVVTEYAAKYFTRILHEDTEGRAVGLSYFRERSFREDIIRLFELGYCLDKRDAFTTEALKNGYRLQYLTTSGLTVDKESYRFDRFSGRVMFPIHSISGRVMAFGGRTLKTDKKVAKYLNSPESEIYHKSHILYGIYFAKKAIVQQDKCYMVEGYTDVISLFQAGIENVVSSSGTSLTVGQIQMIKRFTNNLTILYDGDMAGIKAALRGIDLVLEEGMNVKVLLLPDGEDPDSFSRTMPGDKLVEYIQANEQDFIAFKTKLLHEESKADPVKRAQLISDIVRSVATIPDNIQRSVYIKDCSLLLNVDEQVLYAEVAKIRIDKRKKNNQKQDAYPHFPPDEYMPAADKVYKAKQTEVILPEEAAYRYERELIRVLIRYGHETIKLHPDEEPLEGQEPETIEVSKFIVSELQEDELEFEHPVYNQMYQEYLQNPDGLTERYFVQHPDGTISKMAAELLSSSYILSNIWERGDNYIRTQEITLDKAVPRLVLGFKDQHVRKMLKIIEKQMSTCKDMEEIMELMTKFKHLKEINMAISQKLGERTILN